jgi:hypothetical protein
MNIVVSTQDGGVEIDGVYVVLNDAMPPFDPNHKVIRRLDNEMAVAEVITGSPELFYGTDADDIMAPFISAHATEASRIEMELAPTEYKRKRLAEYPTVEEFMHAWFDGGTVALDALATRRNATKVKYPKS